MEWCLIKFTIMMILYVCAIVIGNILEIKENKEGNSNLRRLFKGTFSKMGALYVIIIAMFTFFSLSNAIILSLGLFLILELFLYANYSYR